MRKEHRMNIDEEDYLFDSSYTSIMEDNETTSAKMTGRPEVALRAAPAASQVALRAAGDQRSPGQGLGPPVGRLTDLRSPPAASQVGSIHATERMHQNSQDTRAAQLKCSLEFVSKRVELVNMMIGAVVQIGNVRGTIVDIECLPVKTFITLRQDTNETNRLKMTKKTMRQVLGTIRRQ